MDKSSGIRENSHNFSVYSNSVLATLNARQSIRELGEDSSDDLLFTMQPTFSKGSRPAGSGVGGKASLQAKADRSAAR